MALWGKWCVVKFGGRVPTNNEPVIEDRIKYIEKEACLQHLCWVVGRGSNPPIMGGRPYSQREF